VHSFVPERMPVVVGELNRFELELMAQAERTAKDISSLQEHIQAEQRQLETMVAVYNGRRAEAWQSLRVRLGIGFAAVNIHVDDENHVLLERKDAERLGLQFDDLPEGEVTITQASGEEGGGI
jgi:hypothetical protein